MTTGSTPAAMPTSMPTNYPKYTVKPWQPDGGFTTNGLITMLGVMFVAGAAIGFAAHFIANYFYLIILFPVAIGFALGWLGVRLVKYANLRNPLLGGLAGFVGGAAAMMMMHYFDYNQFRTAQAAAIQENPHLREVRDATPAQRDEIVAAESPEDRADVRAYLDALAVRNFAGFMDYSARQGVELKKGSGKGLNLGYVGTYIYWVVELLIVAGITFAMVRGQTTEPFCTDCSVWKPFRRLGAFGDSPESALAGVTGGDVNALAAAKPGSINSPLELHVAECANCKRADANVKLELLSTNEKGQVERKVLAHAMWPAESVPVLDSLFAPPPAPAL